MNRDRADARGAAPWWPRARAFWPPTRAPAPSRSASTASSSSRPRSIAAPTARCCSRRRRAAESISGVILYDETLRQKTKDGTPFPQYLTKHGIIPGIKVDTGAKPLAGFPDETITEGLDGLRERLIEYHKLGARFAKWRAVIDIADGIPTPFAIEANAHALARYAALCQENEHRADRRARSAHGRRALASSAARK